MAREAGQTIYSYERRATFVSDGSGAPGDFVALDPASGQVTQTLSDADAGTTDHTNVTGVLSNSKDNLEGFEAGDKVSVVIGGVVVANVAADVVAGNGVGPSATLGEGAAGGTDAQAFSDEGGEFNGPIPAGTAAVDLDGGS